VREADTAQAGGPFSLAVRTALVTGASRGLGLAVAKGLGRAGAHVLVNARTPAAAQAAVDELLRDGLSAEPMTFDATDEAAVEAAFEAVEGGGGRVDIVVNNAAIRARAPLETIAPHRFREVLDANLASAYVVTHAALKRMAPRGYGRIIFVSSVSASHAPRGDAAYVAAKGGMNALMRAIAVEFGGRGITSNAVAPGAFLTQANRPTAEAATPMIEGRVPIGRWGVPAELAGPVVFLASDAGTFVNGHVLVVDGGLSASFH
jgi:gluconate 5-dehydrogenase